MLVGGGTVVLDQVARDYDQSGTPVLVAIMIKYRTQ
jgi:hypothetical protein